jgi:hypothetical protein
MWPSKTSAIGSLANEHHRALRHKRCLAGLKAAVATSKAHGLGAGLNSIPGGGLTHDGDPLLD